MFSLSLVILAIFAIGSVSALDLGFLTGGAEEIVTIDGIDFKIPDGFSEDKDEEIVNESSVQAGVTYDTVVVILVANYGEYNVTDDIIKEIGGNATSIGGVDGYLIKENFFYKFDYAKDGKLVVFSTNDEDVIGDFIVA